jgi:hypothetical protein
VVLAVLTAPPAAAATWQAVDTVGGTGLVANSETSSASPVDYNGDGRQDVFIVYHDRGAKLWRNNGNGTYTRVAAGAWPRLDPASGLVPDRHGCAWADVDRDGRPDVYCAAGRGGNNTVKTGKDNELWLQRSAGVFTEVGTQWGMGDVCGRSHSVAFFDADGDVYPDLFVGNVPPRPVADPCDDPANGLPDEFSKLWLDDGGAGFTYAPGRGIGGYGARCVSTGDFNRDGWQDLLVCGPPDGLRLYRNDAGRGFTDIASANGLTGTEYNDATFGDLDGDGDLDVVMARGNRFVYRLNTAGRLGAEALIGAVSSGAASRVALGRADGDGSLDVYGLTTDVPNRRNPNDVVYRNTGLRFAAVPVPSAGGIGDDVVALDANRDGRAEFLVLNGAEDSTGPIQRIQLVLR